MRICTNTIAIIALAVFVALIENIYPKDVPVTRGIDFGWPARWTERTSDGQLTLFKGQVMTQNLNWLLFNLVCCSAITIFAAVAVELRCRRFALPRGVSLKLVLACLVAIGAFLAEHQWARAILDDDALIDYLLIISAWTIRPPVVFLASLGLIDSLAAVVARVSKCFRPHGATSP